MGTIDIIRTLCTKKGISIKSLEKELGFSNGSLAKSATIKAERLQKIATYFNVSVDYLMTGENKSEQSDNYYYINDETREIAQEIFENPDLRSLFNMSRKMPPERLKAHVDFMRNLYNQENGSNI